MTQASYRIILTGKTLQNFEPTQVVRAAAQLFKCSEEKAQKFFSGKATPLKREMDQATAQRYYDRLLKAGIDCRMEPTAEASGLTLELESTETSPNVSQANIAAASHSGGLQLVDDGDSHSSAGTQNDTAFRCPKCHTPQKKGTECIQCGIIFDKYQPPQEMVITSEENTEVTEDDDPWDETLLFIGDNIDQYRQKFRQIYNNDGKFVLQWHWPAFFITVPWLIYRKMYLWAIAIFIITQLTPWYLLFLIALLPGFFGNFVYYRHAVSKIDKITSNGEQRRQDIIHAGGTNSIPVTIGISLLAALIMSFVMYQLIMAPIVEKAVEHTRKDMAFISKDDKPGAKATKVKMLMLKNALMLQKKVFAKRQPKFHMPVDMDELMKMMGNPPKGDQDYWGTGMTFEIDGDVLVFHSAGKDKTFDTDDDIELRATD